MWFENLGNFSVLSVVSFCPLLKIMHTDRQMSNIISIVNYSHFVSNVQPSSTTTKRSNSAAGNNGLEDKTAQSGDNKGVSFIVIIGAAGSGAVVVGICIITIIVHCKRRKSRYVCETSFPKQSIG